MSAVNYTIRLDETDKKAAEQVFNELGLTLAAGINVYLKTVSRQRKIPFSMDLNERAAAAASLRDAFKTAQEQSIVNGTENMTMDEINSEIAAYRREKRGLNEKSGN